MLFLSYKSKQFDNKIIRKNKKFLFLSFSINCILTQLIVF